MHSPNEAATTSGSQSNHREAFVKSASESTADDVHAGSSSNHIEAPIIQINSEAASLDKLGRKETPASSPGRGKRDLVFLPRSVSLDLLKSELAVMSGWVNLFINRNALY